MPLLAMGRGVTQFVYGDSKPRPRGHGDAGRGGNRSGCAVGSGLGARRLPTNSPRLCRAVAHVAPKYGSHDSLIECVDHRQLEGPTFVTAEDGRQGRHCENLLIEDQKTTPVFIQPTWPLNVACSI